MNIQGGGISFEVSGTNAKLMKVLEQSKRAISTFSKEGVRAGADIDKGFEQAANAIQTAFQKVDAVIDENLQAIKELQAQNEKLQKQYAQAFLAGDDAKANSLKQQVAENNNIIRARQQIIDQAQPIIAELNEEERKLQEQKKAIEGNVEATKSLKAQLRECKEQLAIMEANGQRGTEAYRKMQAEAGRLTDALGDAAQQAKILSHDNQLLQGTMSAVSGIAGAFTAAQGAVALFAGENENLQRIMLKVQSLMSITMGLQQVMNTLNKDSAFQLVIVARAKDMLTAANARLATALGISTAAAQALMATLTLGLSAAITAIVVLISRLSSENAKAAEQQKKFNEEVAKAAGKPLSAYIQLKTEWENLTGSMKDREKWVKDNEDRFNALGLKVYDAKTAEDVLIKNSKNFVAACIAKAKALAAQQLAAEKYEEILKKQAEEEAMPDKVTKVVGAGMYARVATVENSEKADAEKELEKMRTEAKKFVEMQMQFSKQEQQFLSKLGAAAQTTVAGSVEAVEKEIASLQAQYKRAATDSARADLAKKIKAEQEKLKKIQLDTGSGKGSGGSGNTPKDPYLDMLQKRKTAYAQYSKWVQSEDAEVREAASTTFAELLKEGTSYLDYLEKQRKAISSKATKTAADLQRLQNLNNEIAEQTKQTVLSDFEAQLNRELEQCNTISQRLEALAKRRGELANDNSDTDRGKAGILEETEARILEQAKQETAQLLQEYAAYTNERIKFEESYARNRELLNATIHAKELDTEDEFIAKMLEAKEQYAAYAKEMASEDATVAASAKQRYAELLKQGTSYAEMLRNKIREIEDRQVKVGVEISGIKHLAALREELRAIEDEKALVALRQQIRALEDKQITVGLDVEGTELLNELRQQIAQLEDKLVKVGLEVDGQDQLNALRTRIQQLEDRKVKVGLDVEGTQQLADLRRQVRAIEDRQIQVSVDVQRAERLQALSEQVRGLEDRIVNIGLDVEDGRQIEALRRQIRTLEDRRVSVGLDVEGYRQLNQLRASLRVLEDKQINVVLDVEGTEQLQKLRQLLTAEDVTDGQVQAAIQALANLEKKAKEYAKSSGSAFYDELREQYRTYQQQLSDIQETYAEQRAEAEKQGNSQMIAEINAKEQAELSKLAASRLMASESWNQLFSDLSTLSAKTINKLMADINAQKVTLSAQFNPADLQAINTQLEKAKEELHKRNPFLALRDALAELRASMKANKLFEEDSDFGRTLREKKAQYQQYAQEMASADETVANSAGERYKTLLQEGTTFTEYLKRRIEALKQQKVKIGVEFDGEQELANLEAILKKEQGEGKTTGEALKATFQSVGSSIEFIKGCFDSVVGGMKKMGVQMDAETETILNDIGGMMDGAAQFAQGYATMNPLQMIQGTVGFMSSVFDLFNTRDKRAEESIERHQAAVKRLGNAYNQLKHEVDKALGDTVYKNQNSMIANLRQQQKEIRGMIEDEESKKHTDWDRIEEWREQIAEAGRQIEDIIDEISKSITQTNAKDLASSLADALVEAFEAGEDAADAFGKVANDVLKNAVKNALKLQFLEKPLQNAISQLQRDMGFDEEGNGAFNGISATEQARFKDAIAQAGANFNQAMQMYKDLFAELDENDPSTLSGAIKGASQESIDLLAGQANAVRVNQVTSLDIMRQQLTRLSNIDANVGVIAGRLLTIINKLTTPADDGLRGQGILE